MTLAHKLHYLMLSTGISQIELSNQTKIERSTLTRILNSSTLQPKIDTIYTLAKYFNVEVIELLDSMHDTDQIMANQKEQNVQMVLSKLMPILNIPNASVLSKKTGLPPNVLSDIIKGRTTNPKIKTSQILADFFNISIPQLYGIDPLPVIEALAPTCSIQKLVPLLNFDQLQAWLTNTIDINSLRCITVNVQIANEQQYALEIRGSTFFPDLLAGNILLIDKTISPANGDLIVVMKNQLISIYEQIKTNDTEIILRKAGTKKKEPINANSINILGTVIQQIINRN